MYLLIPFACVCLLVCCGVPMKVRSKLAEDLRCGILALHLPETGCLVYFCICRTSLPLELWAGLPLCPAPPSRGHWDHGLLPLAFAWALGVELQPSGLYSKCFHPCAPAQLLTLTYLLTTHIRKSLCLLYRIKYTLLYKILLYRIKLLLL